MNKKTQEDERLSWWSIRDFPRELRDRIHIYALKRRKRISDVVAKACEQYLKRVDG